MKLDTTIAGVQTAKLKQLLRKERFTTPEAMRILGLEEPEASSVLGALRHDDWVRFEATEEHVDVWSTGDRGRRLVATKLLKRISIAEARGILDRVVPMVRLMNADPERSTRVTGVVVFGSTITPHAEDAGDVDLVVETAWRRLPEAELKALRRREAKAMGIDEGGLEELIGTKNRPLREIAKLSRYISLHSREDVDAIRAAYRQVYAFDLDSEREVAADDRISCPEPKGTEGSEGEAVATGDSRAVLAPVPWPAPGKRRMAVRIDADAADLAAHMWANGASREAIAAKTRLDKAEVGAFLSWQNEPVIGHTSGISFSADPRMMVGRMLGGSLGDALVDITLRVTARERSAQVYLIDDRFGAVGRIGSYPFDIEARDACAWRCMQAILRVIDAWIDGARSKLVGLEVRAHMRFEGSAVVAQAAAARGRDPMPNLRGVAAALDGALATDPNIPWGRHASEWEVICDLVRDREPRFLRWDKDAAVQPTDGSRTRVGEAIGAAVTRDAGWLGGFESFVLKVSGHRWSDDAWEAIRARSAHDVSDASGRRSRRRS